MATHVSPILVFDSGIGGLSVLRDIRALLPSIPFVYCADNRIYPYGLQDESVLIERVGSLVPFLIAEYAPQVVVIACNSASTVVLDSLRAQVRQPVIGVVPAIKPAAAQSQRRVIGLLATPGTVKRAYTAKLIDEFAGDCHVIKVGSNDLVMEAENKLRGGVIDSRRLEDALQAFREAPIPPDIIVLGCTHFPFLHEELSELLPTTRFIDSGAAIARRTQSLISATQTGASIPASRVIFTAQTGSPHELLPALQRFGIDTIDYIDR